MKRPQAVIFILLAITVTAVLFWRLGRDSVAESDAAAVAQEAASPVVEQLPADQMPAFARRVSHGWSEEIFVPEGAVAGVATLVFHPDDIDAAIEQLRLNGIAVEGVIRQLGVIKVRLDSESLARLQGLYDDAVELGYVYPVSVPAPVEVEAAGGIGTKPFRDGWLQAIGVTGDTSGLGAGVSIALIDSGVRADGIANDVIHMGGEPGGDHGTLMASFIAEMAPGAQLLDLGVMDTAGVTDSFSVAEAIVRAVDAGADVINLSLGSYGDSAVLSAAIDYAASQGVPVVASAGNEGYSTLAYPAAYDFVYGVTAVDANNRLATFSNSGSAESGVPDFGSPGVGTWVEFEGATVQASGTSSAAAITSAAVAVVASELGIDTTTAAALLQSTANDTGAPGQDVQTGDGTLNIERALESGKAGIYNLALADQYMDPARSNAGASVILITVENRGTETIPSGELLVQYEGRQEVFDIGSLQPGETAWEEIVITAVQAHLSGGTEVVSAVRTTDVNEVTVEDNVKGSVFVAPSDE